MIDLEASVEETTKAIVRFGPDALREDERAKPKALSEDQLAEGLRARDFSEVHETAKAAIEAGPRGDAALAAVLREARTYSRVLMAAAIGDAHGNVGPVALREVLAAPDSDRDLRCAALLALAKRCGAAASPDLTQALGHRDGTVKDYAVIGLAGTGDASAWELVFGRLKQHLARTRVRTTNQSEVSMCLSYLGQHLATDDQRTRLRKLILQRRDRLQAEERAWIRGYWPSLAPDEPSLDLSDPDADSLRQWARSLLFGPAL